MFIVGSLNNNELKVVGVNSTAIGAKEIEYNEIRLNGFLVSVN